MKTFTSKHQGVAITAYLSDACADAAEAVKAAIGTPQIGAAVARLGSTAIANQDNEAWTLFTIANAELAQHLEINMEEAIRDTFNRVSEREGFPERL